MTSLKQFLSDNNQSEIDQYFEKQARFLIEKNKLETIDNFNGYFDFLNNEFPCPVYFDGLVYKSVSHAYQAARSTEQYIREKIVRADTIMEMYEIAAKIEDPADWNKARLKVMETLIRDKFRRNADLREKLKATEKRALINSYGDATTSNLFWGMVEGKGQNQIGRILESLRNDIQQNIELEKWIFMTFELEDNVKLLPKIKLECLKGDGTNEEIKVERKNTLFMGKLVGSDVLMTHQSISRRHAAIICDSNMGVCLIDVGSKGGSFLNGNRCDNCVPYRLKPNDTLNFGSSTRKYKISIDITDAERYVKHLQNEMKRKEEDLHNLNNPDLNPNALKATLGVKINDQIFVSGFPENISQTEVKEFFSQFGEVKNVNIPIDRKTGKTRQFALITFKSPTDCQKAVDAAEIEYKNTKRRLRIRYAEKRGYDDHHHDNDGKVDRSRRERYAEDARGHRERIGKDVERRHRRRNSRSRSRSKSPRRRRDDRDSRRNRDRERERSKDRRKKKRSESRSSSSSSGSESRSKERGDRKKEKEEKESKKDEGKSDKKQKSEGEKKNKRSESRSESAKKEEKSVSRSRERQRRKEKEGTKKDDDRAERRRKEKKRSKSSSESESRSRSRSKSKSKERTKHKNGDKKKDRGEKVARKRSESSSSDSDDSKSSKSSGSGKGK